MRSDYFSTDVQAFLRVLAKHEVRYLLIGGLAVIYHGYARLTGDVDFFYDREPDNTRRLWAALLEFWDGSVPALERPEELTDPDLVVQFGRPPNRIDLLGGLRSVSFADAWERRVDEAIMLDADSIPVFIIGLDDLLRSKRDAGRPKDLDDLQQLGDS